MLKITTHKEKKKILFVLEGKLAAPWTSALEACWLEAKRLPNSQEIHFEFSDITFVDYQAKKLLKRMATDGAKFIANDIQMKAIVEKLKQDNHSENQEENHVFKKM